MSDGTKPKGMLFDMVRCAGCRKCVQACLDCHDFKKEARDVQELSATAFTSMIEKEDGSVRNMCRHCLDPACASVCPVGALIKTDEGPVVYDEDKCIGCRYCMVACPFSIPRYEWDEPVPAVQKCDMCFERIRDGGIPACAEACEYEATLFGTREELLCEARTRIADDPDEYYDHVYGECEIGGTSVLFLAPDPGEDFGYQPILGTAPLPSLTMRQLKRVPPIVVGGSAALMAIWWITNRRDEVRAHEQKTASKGSNGNGRS